MEYTKGFFPLTPQELKILAHVATGKSNQQVGAVTQLTEKTVKNYLYRIYQCLAVQSRTEMILVALKSGILVVDKSRDLVLSEHYKARTNGGGAL